MTTKEPQEKITAASKNGAGKVDMPKEINYDILQEDIDGLAQVFTLARQTSVNDEHNLTQLIVFKQRITEKLTRLIKT